MRLSKYILQFFALCLAMSFSSFVVFADNHGKEKSSDIVVHKIQVYKVEERNKALVEAEQILDELDGRIEALQMKVDNNWDTLSREAQEETRATMRELQKKRIAVAEWYGGLKRSSDEAWEDVKLGFSNAYQDLKDAWKKASSEF